LKFLIDSMLPPATAELLAAAGHDAKTPAQLGAHNLPDDTLIALAATDHRVIVTGNASDFDAVMGCPVLLVRKARWPQGSLASKLADALDRWAGVNEQPGDWAHWLAVDAR
jgi:predicted nuclease of predicted toxin-antitoxin system